MSVIPPTKLMGLLNNADLFKIISFEYAGRLDRLESVGNKIYADGWALYQKNCNLIVPDGIVVVHEQEYIAFSPLNTDRKDVAAHFGFPGQDLLGFSFSFTSPFSREQLSFYALCGGDSVALLPLSGSQVYRGQGFCPVCEQYSIFSSKEFWLRDHLHCSICNSLPRERHFQHVLNTYIPGWKDLSLYEIAPDTPTIRNKCRHYTRSQYFPNNLEKYVEGVRNENIEDRSFPDSTFDVIVCSDVLEHVFQPDRAVREMFRVLKVGEGGLLFSMPIFDDREETTCRAKLTSGGAVEYIMPPNYHGNPVDTEGALVVWDYGRDFCKLLDSWLHGLNYKYTIDNMVNIQQGIAGEFLEIIILSKRERSCCPDTFALVGIE